MKKTLTTIAVFTLIISMSSYNVFAAKTDYQITASTTSGGADMSSIDVNKDQPSDVYFTLKGLDSATKISDAIYSISVTKPNDTAKVTLLAVDTEGNQMDVTQIEHWGPSAGFLIGANTKYYIKFIGTFDTVGMYTINVNLKELSTGDILTTKALTVNVMSQQTETNEEEQKEEDEKELEENPRTGDSGMLEIFIIMSAAGILMLMLLKKKRTKENY